MPVGTSDGQYYESDLHALFDIKPGVDAPTELTDASKSQPGTGVAEEKQRTGEAPSPAGEASTEQVPITEDKPLQELQAEGKKYHFRFTPEDFKNKFGKDPIHNDFDEIFRFKNGDYGVHIAPPVPKPDPGVPVGSNPSASDIASMTHQPEQPNPAAPYVEAAKRVGEGFASPLIAAKNLTQSAMRGEDLMNPESIRQSWEATTGLAGTGVTGAGSGLGVFGGIGARTADYGAFRQALKLDRRGFPASEIYDQTGWYRDADEEWKHYISDEGFKLKPKITEGSEVLLPKGGTTLGQLIEHPGLFKAYPEAKHIKVDSLTSAELESGLRGQMDLNKNLLKVSPQDEGTFKEMLIHEIQHWVQNQEGFAQGSSLEFERQQAYPKELTTLFPKHVSEAELRKRYLASSGEIEARNAQFWSTLTDTERKMLEETEGRAYPWDTEAYPSDVPRSVRKAPPESPMTQERKRALKL